MALPITEKHFITVPSAFSPLIMRKFGILWLGAILSNTGFWIQMVGQGWQVLQLTNSAFLLGLVSFAATLPNLILSLFGGVLADRFNRRHVLIVCHVFYMGSAAFLGVLTMLHLITVWCIIMLKQTNFL